MLLDTALIVVSFVGFEAFFAFTATKLGIDL